MACHADTDLFTDRDHSIQEILVVLTKPVCGHAFILLQRGLELCQTLRLPSGKRESVAVCCGLADDLQRSHVAQVLLVKIQAVGAILRDQTRQVRSEPVKYRHEVVDDDFYAVFCQVADGDVVVLDVFVAGRKPHLDVFVYVDALDDLAFQSGFVDLVDKCLDLFLGPYLACRLIIEEAHQSGHTGDLLDLA